MAWSEKLKLNKNLLNKVNGLGYESPKEIQQKTLARIYGGQDLIAIGPEGCGKTTTYILSVSNRMGYSSEGVPRVLILVPTKEHVLEVISRFEELNQNKPLQLVGLYAAPGTESQMNALADGADIVVATPDRARSIYLKLGLNLNKIELLIIDDADQIVKQGLQLPVAELANSITKAQHLVFTEVMHDKLQKMINPFMENAAVVEIEEIAESKIETLPQVLYHVPNFITKLNLLNLFMQDDELFTKTIVFVNTRQTAEKIYKTLQNRQNTTVAIFKSWSIEFKAIMHIEEFKESEQARILIIADEETRPRDLTDIPFLIHFELPAEKEIFIERATKRAHINEAEETLALTFATDLELTLVKRIEQAIGKKIPLGELPEDLVIEQERKSSTAEEKQPVKTKVTAPVAGEAFHQKKPENAKTYNYSSGQKAKMNNKRKHG
ncbi:DEAD/DEAH box helicase [Mucilaginibacter sp.]|uniref:DEAD/DEAH box helicase n=1 Tax=Mucilaginibacter sp. TaxID=1882438 RepID=UPI00284B46C5|nr:DEAD/DEAH box helicase [Mucilaginibacter sp.]MDR3695892.1 DEAD/DEAH box helicase [Mucilaginibacter sp.]